MEHDYFDGNVEVDLVFDEDDFLVGVEVYVDGEFAGFFEEDEDDGEY